jgi:hypothetical protein
MNLFRLTVALVLSLVGVAASLSGLAAALLGSVLLAFADHPHWHDDLARVVGGFVLMALAMLINAHTDKLLDGE